MEIAYEKEAESEKSGQRDSFASFYYISFWYFRGGCFFRRAMIAYEIAENDRPVEFVRSYNRNQTMVKISLVLPGESSGISNTGESFSEDELDFSAGGTVDGLPISRSYINYMGTWAYSMKCPVE